MQTLQNLFLAALADDARERWQPRLESVVLQAGQVLQDFGREPQYLYFPHTAVITLQQRQKNGTIADVALVGVEGVVGAHLLFGADATAARSVVLMPGEARRLPLAEFQKEVEADVALLRATLQYLQHLVRQMAVTALCGLHHSPMQILSRRVLELADRLPAATDFGQALCLQGFAPHAMQPAREALLQLCESGAVRLDGEQVSVVQRTGLERHVCGCYTDARSTP